MTPTTGSGDGTPVLFIHGLWLHPTSWYAWEKLFQEKGFTTAAPGWPGVAGTVEASREDPEAIAGKGIDEVTDHYARIVEAMPSPPVLVGHSFGGMIAQKLLGKGYGCAAVAIDAAQFKGVLPVPLSALRATFPVFRNPSNRRKAVSLTSQQFRYAFGNAVSAEESDQLHSMWAIPAPGRPLFEAAAANFSRHSPAAVDTHADERGPLLLIMGRRDRTVPEAITKSEYKQQNASRATTDLMEYRDRGHSLTIDSGWREIAEDCLIWIGRHVPAMA
ncbi:alpha/beta hydrolase [Actinospica robiniae]|uniref:alpha/beta hydrolase n=1 Tax=Actinospica robiniae TaxID=304901 RepID=UPI0005534AAB|nr:alpha/beta hydrolase [Actinospica robiniae]